MTDIVVGGRLIVTGATARVETWGYAWRPGRRALAWAHKPPANGARECAWRRAQIVAGRLRIA